MTLRAHRGEALERCDKCGRRGALPEWQKHEEVYPYGPANIIPEHLHFECPCGFEWNTLPLDARSGGSARSCI